MTRQRAACVGWALLAFATAVRCEEPRAVIQRAIKATGGDGESVRTASTSARITVKGNDGIPIMAAGEVWFQSVTALRMDLSVEFGGQKQRGIVVFDGKSSWA